MAALNGRNGKHAGITDDAVCAKTGRTWTEWVAALDDAGARDLDHAALATLIHERFGVGPWWTQMVAVGYEQAVGKRLPRQKADGFAASASKTLNATPGAVFGAFNDARTRTTWLADEFTIRKATAPKSLRITWKDGTTWLDVNIYARTSGRSMVSLQHTRLASVAAAERMKKYWSEALARLAAALE